MNDSVVVNVLQTLDKTRYNELRLSFCELEAWLVQVKTEISTPKVLLDHIQVVFILKGIPHVDDKGMNHLGQEMHLYSSCLNTPYLIKAFLALDFHSKLFSFRISVFVLDHRKVAVPLTFSSNFCSSVHEPDYRIRANAYYLVEFEMALVDLGGEIPIVLINEIWVFVWIITNCAI
jgi:hypothetical protein